MYKIMKRILDFCAALFLLVILSPVLLVVAILIKIIDGEEIFFNQKRPGRYGKIFTMYKFKTMKKPKTEAQSDMERLTRLGAILRKLSLDELPQLLNIVKGEMSFIGPRPLLIRYLQYYSPEQMKRHDCLPGISGYAQVNGRNVITWEERFKLDVYYVEHISLLLDMKILFQTIACVITGSGVNQAESETRVPFDEEKRARK